MLTQEQAQELGRRLYSRRDAEMVRVDVEGGQIGIPMDADEVMAAVLADAPDPLDEIVIQLEEEVIEIEMGDESWQHGQGYHYIRVPLTNPLPRIAFDRRTDTLTIGEEHFETGTWAATPTVPTAHRAGDELEVRVKDRVVVAATRDFGRQECLDCGCYVDDDGDDYCEDCE